MEEKRKADRLSVTPNCLYYMFASNTQGESDPLFCISSSIRNNTIHAAKHV